MLSNRLVLTFADDFDRRVVEDATLHGDLGLLDRDLNRGDIGVSKYSFGNGLGYVLKQLAARSFDNLFDGAGRGGYS